MGVCSWQLPAVGDGGQQLPPRSAAHGGLLPARDSDQDVVERLLQTITLCCSSIQAPMMMPGAIRKASSIDDIAVGYVGIKGMGSSGSFLLNPSRKAEEHEEQTDPRSQQSVVQLVWATGF